VKKILTVLIGKALKHPYVLIFLSAIITVISLSYAVKLDIETDFINLIPEDYESVKALEKVRATVGGEGSDLAVGILSPNLEASKKFAEDLIEEAMSLSRNPESEKYFASVEYKREISFLEENALYFATESEIEEIKGYLREEIENAKLEVNPFFVDFSDDLDQEDVSESDLDKFQDLYDWLVGREYPVHEDESSLTLRFFPSGSQSNVRYINQVYSDIEDLIIALDPKEYHPEMEYVLAGRLMHRAIQVEAIRNDVAKTFGIGVGAVLLLVCIYFMYKSYIRRKDDDHLLRSISRLFLKLPFLLLIISVPLLMSITWTFGLAYLLIGNLNMMTSTLALLLFGLGVDFGVHFFARYSEERKKGSDVNGAVYTTIFNTGKAISAGSVTTCLALFILGFADFRGFSEFGIIAGYGIVFAMIAMLLIMPALIKIFESWGVLKLDLEDSAKTAMKEERQLYPGRKTILLLGTLTIVASIILVPNISFEYQFNKLDPQYPEYDAKKAIVDQASSGRRGSNPAFIVTESPEEALRVADEIRRMIHNDTSITTIAEVRTLQDRFPLKFERQISKLESINEVRELLESEYLQNEDSEDLVKLSKAAQTTDPVEIDMVPKFLKDSFVTQDGEFGTFIMIYPSGTLSDGRRSIEFANEIGEFTSEDGTKYYAGSTSIIAADMLMLLQKESPWMITGAFLVVFIMMVIIFRSFKWALIAAVPLILGITWMLLVMFLFGLKLNFFNLVIFPALLGIGNDDGIHMVHRYLEEGRGSIMKVLRSTGEHCTIGTFTTMIGFFGLIFSFHPGLQSIGLAALIGVFTVLIATLILIPAIISVMEEYNII